MRKGRRSVTVRTVRAMGGRRAEVASRVACSGCSE